MKIREAITGIIKLMHISKGNLHRLRLVVFFTAGMALTAALAHTPLTAEILSPRSNEESILPVAPSTPDLIKPGINLDTGSPVIIELV